MANRVTKFVLDSGGTTYIGTDATGSPSTPIISKWSTKADGVFTRLIVDTHYIVAPPTSDDGAAGRTQIAAYLEATRTAMKWKPPVLKELARGVAVIPNTFSNRGSVKRDDGTTLLANCFLESVAVTDDEVGMNAVGLQFVFVAVAPRAAP